MMCVIVIIGCFENQIFEQSDIDNRIFGQTNVLINGFADG